MKYSIKTIIKNLSIFLIILTFSVGVVTFLIIEQNSSYSRINNLQNQKNIIKGLANLQKQDIELALIQFNGKSTQLKHEINKLHNIDNYDYIGKYILKNSSEHLSDLNRLSKLTQNFNQSASAYYIKNIQNEEEKNQDLKNNFHSLIAFINSMIFKDISYNEEKFHILEKISIFTFALTIFITFWYRKRLNLIYRDILHLYSIDKNKKDYEIFSQEADAIQLRMGRKPASTNNPALLDPVTQINNYKGMVSSYSTKKGMKDSNFTSVTILEIDNFSKKNRAYSQEFTQTLLKKVAFTISLHEQATDVIARTDYNQFSIILSRSSKEQSFKDVDIIRQSISEIKLKAQGEKPINITVSGGFIIKPNNQSLDEALRQAKSNLLYAKKKGENTISQTRDVAEQDL